MSLTNRQKRFVEFYLQSWNATDSARRAGYKHPNMAGPRLILNDGIQKYVKIRMRETQLTTDDVLSRLGEQASANYSDFFHFDYDEEGEPVISGVNWGVFKARGHLVKKLSYDRKGNPVLEFHDAQTALIQIGKALGALRENINQHTTNEDLQVHFYLPSNDRGADDQDD